MKGIKERINFLLMYKALGKRVIAHTINSGQFSSNCHGMKAWIYGLEKQVEELSEDIPFPDIYVKDIRTTSEGPPFIDPFLMEKVLEKYFHEIKIPLKHGSVGFYLRRDDKPILAHTAVILERKPEIKMLHKINRSPVPYEEIFLKDCIGQLKRMNSVPEIETRYYQVKAQ